MNSVSPTKQFNYSKLLKSSSKVNLMKGSSCFAANSSEKLPTEALDSLFSVNSEESLGFLNGFDHKCNA